jgi:hypothetical protein
MMTIKSNGGIFGRNPTFNNVTVDGILTVDQIVEKTGAAGITLDGVTLKDGNVVLADGKGIDFSATAGTGTSELFDDYEEGTWTPVIKSSGGATPTLTTATGVYQKVGNSVTVWFNVVSSDNLADSAYYILEGLPYSNSNNDPNYVGTAYAAQTTISRGSTHGIETATATRLYIFVAQISGSANTFAFSDQIKGVATYRTA